MSIVTATTQRSSDDPVAGISPLFQHRNPKSQTAGFGAGGAVEQSLFVAAAKHTPTLYCGSSSA